ncbi:MAG: pentapeptide repeat-containing protein [Cyanobacteria bacterium P01_A01_bin.40]
MADETHLKILREGVKVWNQWRKDNPDIEPDLSRSQLKDANLYGINLSRVNLTGVDFTGADLRSAQLIHANLYGANFFSSNLTSADLRKANLGGAYLFCANLSRVDLRSASLYDVDLGGAYLFCANLSGTNLNSVRALATNFEGGILTGACIEDWNINSKTNLKDVECDFIYLEKNEQNRRPHDPNKIFAPGEFTHLFQKALETVDLIFSEGIEWTTFLKSFHQLQAEVKSEDLSIQAIEKKSSGAFVVRLEVPEEANKAEIEKYIKQEYEVKLKVIEASYQKQLKAKDEELIQVYREKSIDMLRVVEMLSNSQQNTIINNSPNTYNQSGQIGIGHNEGVIKDNAKIAGVYNEAAPQDLMQAAEKIQQLLDQLQQTNDITLEAAQQQVAKDLATKAKSDRKLKDKLIQLGKFISDNSARTIVSEGVKGAIKLFLLMI